MSLRPQGKSIKPTKTTNDIVRAPTPPISPVSSVPLEDWSADDYAYAMDPEGYVFYDTSDKYALALSSDENT